MSLIVQCIKSATSVQGRSMFLKRANYLAEIKILLYISQERLHIPSIGFVLWATGFMMSTFRID